MQFNGKQPLGVVYNTTMNRPDAALTLALLYGLTGKREARIGSICVNGSGLGAAVFCDVVSRFYTPGPLRNANQTLPPGLALQVPLPPDPPMVKPAIERKNDKGEVQYPRSLSKITDTSLAEAVIRNGVIFNAEAVLILSAPATYLAKTFDLQGTKEIYKQRVRMLVVVEAGEGGVRQDVPALRRVLAEWPGPIVYCGKEIGEALPFPAASIERDFGWAPTNPVTDAYRAYKAMPYDAPSWDLAATLYAVHPDQGFFDTEQGTIQVADDGALKFAAGSGNHKALRVDPDKRDKVIQTLVELASAKPVVPPQRVRPPQVQDVKKPAEAKP
ncbi:MAG: hypothetical protein QOJ99_5282 [Bryobacterales bacterium]|jgi:hypothetical protein|nr:hypothetical protein [Bryobacterales bacterium]